MLLCSPKKKGKNRGKTTAGKGRSTGHATTEVELVQIFLTFKNRLRTEEEDEGFYEKG
jgi:hypothetical protein